MTEQQDRVTRQEFRCMAKANLFHVDVFGSGPLSGNGLTVFLGAEEWTSQHMQLLAQEMRQFESAFLSEITQKCATARVFTVDEELPFAGHPILGAAAVLHETQVPRSLTASWSIRLPAMDVAVSTARIDDYYRAEMNQGRAILGKAIGYPELRPVLSRLGLDLESLVADLPAQVVSTGLPYLVLPVRSNALQQAAIRCPDFEEALRVLGAKFVLVFDPSCRELRTWDNQGKVEDVATGSAAGPAAAYLYAHGLVEQAQPIELVQGRFVGRPSKIAVARDRLGALLVSGEVRFVSRGILEVSQ